MVSERASKTLGPDDLEPRTYVMITGRKDEDEDRYRREALEDMGFMTFKIPNQETPRVFLVMDINLPFIAVREVFPKDNKRPEILDWRKVTLARVSRKFAYLLKKQAKKASKDQPGAMFLPMGRTC